jgi:hypothetical protein
LFSQTKVVKGLGKPIGPKSSETPATSDSKGRGRDRMAARMLVDIASKIDFSLAHQQTAEIAGIMAGEYALNDINPSVRKVSGLDVHEKELLSPEKKQTFTRFPR